jgi:6-phosphogluconolactonase (cycloisomerase 2 family)
MKRRILMGAGLLGVLLGLNLGGAQSGMTAIAQGRKPVVPIFEVDARFPTMPDHTVLGGVGGVAADSHGNVWVFHRPHTLEEGNALENGYKPAPPVLQFDETGKFIQGWGGPSATGEYQWTNRGGLHSAYAECASCSSDRRTNGDGRPGTGEHGIYVDHKDNVWVTGNGDGDGQILKFTKNGKFLLQIGHAGTKADSNDQKNVSRATTVVVHPKTNEVLVADGYGNRRVVVFDADTGAYKRHWGAYGNKPDDKAPRARLLSGPGSQQFNTPHGIAISNDDLVYVADRANNRVQAFRLDGTFVKEGYNRRESLGTGSAFGVALSGDPQQRFVYVADGSNERIAILDRNTLELVGSIGGAGRKAGEFFHLHSIATDPKGNIIAGESQGYRVQKFVYKGTR